MQRNTIFFIAVKDLHVSDGFPAHHQELKNCTYSIWYLLSLVVATASVKLYMFQAVSPPIIRSSKTVLYSIWYLLSLVVTTANYSSSSNN
jgi:hypothetical protein